jgi:hypothetical protein
MLLHLKLNLTVETGRQEGQRSYLSLDRELLDGNMHAPEDTTAPHQARCQLL